MVRSLSFYQLQVNPDYQANTRPKISLRRGGIAMSVERWELDTGNDTSKIRLLKL